MGKLTITGISSMATRQVLAELGLQDHGQQLGAGIAQADLRWRLGRGSRRAAGPRAGQPRGQRRKELARQPGQAPLVGEPRRRRAAQGG